MNELLQRASLYEYEDDGRKPLDGPSLREEDETRPYEISDGGHVTYAFLENAQSINPPNAPDTNQQGKNNATNAVEDSKKGGK